MRPFDLLCGLISVALGHRTADSDLAAAVAATDVPWPRLVTLSGVHLLTPALAPALRDEALCGAVPPELVDYLSAMHAAATQRNAALRCQLEQVAAHLNGFGIVPVALKGAIRLIDGLWPDPALRFMHDLDLLVPETALAPCAATLAELGWRQFPAGPGETEHHLALIHPEATVRIELHHQPLSDPHTALLPAARMLARATPARTRSGHGRDTGPGGSAGPPDCARHAAACVSGKRPLSPAGPGRAEAAAPTRPRGRAACGPAALHLGRPAARLGRQHRDSRAQPRRRAIAGSLASDAFSRAG